LDGKEDALHEAGTCSTNRNLQSKPNLSNNTRSRVTSKDEQDNVSNMDQDNERAEKKQQILAQCKDEARRYHEQHMRKVQSQLAAFQKRVGCQIPESISESVLKEAEAVDEQGNYRDWGSALSHEGLIEWVVDEEAKHEKGLCSRGVRMQTPLEVMQAEYDEYRSVPSILKRIYGDSK